MTLKEAYDKARSEKRALGHFNISDIAAFRAIIRAAGDLDLPILIGTSGGEADFIDIDVAVAMVKDARKETGQDIFLNADHFKDLEKAKEAARAGYDSIIFDAAKLPLEKNIEKNFMGGTVEMRGDEEVKESLHELAEKYGVKPETIRKHQHLFNQRGVIVNSGIEIKIKIRF